MSEGPHPTPRRRFLPRCDLSCHGRFSCPSVQKAPSEPTARSRRHLRGGGPTSSTHRCCCRILVPCSTSPSITWWCRSSSSPSWRANATIQNWDISPAQRCASSTSCDSTTVASSGRCRSTMREANCSLSSTTPTRIACLTASVSVTTTPGSWRLPRTTGWPGTPSYW